MSSLATLLPDFGGTDALAGNAMALASQPSDDANALTSFENGYQAGWDDAVSAAGQQTNLADQKLLDALTALSASSRSAVLQVTQSFEPLLMRLMESVLPEIGRETLVLHIVSALRPMIPDANDLSARLEVNADAARRLEPILAVMSHPSITLSVEDSLADGQANLSFAGKEVRLDLNAVCDDLRQAVDGILFENRKELAYGT